MNIQAEVSMNDHIAESRHLGPVHLGHHSSPVRWEVFGRLSDDLKIADDRIEDHVLGLKLFERQALCVALDLSGTFEDILG